MFKEKTAGVRKILRAAGHFLPHELSYANLLWTVMLLAFVFLYHMKDGVHSFPLTLGNIAILLLSILTLNLLWQFFSLLTNRSRLMRRIAFFLFAVLYWLLASYRHRSKCSLDYAVAADNTGEAFTLEALATIVDAVGVVFLILLPVFIVILIFVEKKTGAFTKTVHKKYLSFKVAVVLLLYVAFSTSSWATRDEMLFFVQSGYQYHTEDSRYIADYKSGTFPFWKKGDLSVSQLKKSDRPHIFFVMMESFNAHFVESKTKKGVPYTPYFNSLIKKGLYVEKFYGNSIQTCKGQFAALFSLVPSIRGKVFKRYEATTRFRSLPALLQGSDYETIFFQCYKKLSYDNTGSFLKKNGFKRVETVFDYLKQEDKNNLWGWGVQDGVFYKRFFEYLDKSYRNTAKKGPVFATLATTVNHLPFDKVPVGSRFVFPKPRSVRQNYANSIRLSDMGLRDFFKELNKRSYLRNSIVVITGDHSFPIGEHGYYHNEVSFYEEFFRTPLLIIWNGRLRPQRVKVAGSHMDIAPTLLDLLQIQQKGHHFVGRSLVRTGLKNSPIYLVQPYNGRYLGIVNYPYKYVKHFRTRKEFLFNLAKDPSEAKNLIKQLPGSFVDKFRNELKFIFLNQKLLDNDALIPR